MDVSTKATAAKLARKRPPGTLLFLPGFANRTEVIQWLKRIHAWTGFWGALAFLLIGMSGLLLNHRSTLKIDTGAPVEVMEASIAVDPALIKSPEDLGKWAQTQFGTALEPRAPRAEGGPPRGQRGDQPAGERGGERIQMMGRDIQEAVVWKQSFNGANATLNVEYTPGSAAVKASKSEQNVWGVLKNMHKGSGMNWIWVLFIDTMAGGLIAMALTGALLWSRLHGPRLAAIGIVGVSLGMAVFAAWPGMV
ncbi:MAG: PepSY-associated TM helix domain-containing protein [Betaproteobacteria bacterium]